MCVCVSITDPKVQVAVDWDGLRHPIRKMRSMDLSFCHKIRVALRKEEELGRKESFLPENKSGVTHDRSAGHTVYG